MNEKEARSLTRRIRGHWRDLEKLLNEAITGNAWAPLGYQSFTEWYDSELLDLPLAKGARNMVVIIMLSEEYASQREIAHMIGVHESIISRIKKAWEQGLVTPFLPPQRKAPVRKEWDPHHVWVGTKLDKDLHFLLKQWARGHDKTIHEIQQEALQMYADLYIIEGKKPTAAERKPRKVAATEAKFQPPEE